MPPLFFCHFSPDIYHIFKGTLEAAELTTVYPLFSYFCNNWLHEGPFMSNSFRSKMRPIERPLICIHFLSFFRKNSQLLSVIVGSPGDCILNQRLLRKGVRVKWGMPEELTGLVEAPVSKQSTARAANSSLIWKLFLSKDFFLFNFVVFKQKLWGRRVVISKNKIKKVPRWFQKFEIRLVTI